MGRQAGEIAPRLLNPNDWIELQLIVDGQGNLFGDDPHDESGPVTTRFAGQSRPMQAGFEGEGSRRPRFYASILGSMMGAASAWAVYSASGRSSLLWWGATAATVLTLVLVYGIVVLYMRRANRKARGKLGVAH